MDDPVISGLADRSSLFNCGRFFGRVTVELSAARADV